MKKIISIALIALSIFALVGCTPKEPAANVPVNDIMDSIKEQVKTDLIAGGVKEEQFKDGKLPGYMITDIMTDENNPTAKLFNKEEVEEGLILQHMMNVNSNLIIVVKAKDDKVDAVKEVLAKIKEQQDKVWKQYLPDQYDKVKANVIEAKDNYVIYATYDDSAKLKEVFEKSFEKKE